jgi:hypothetical protein
MANNSASRLLEILQRVQTYLGKNTIAWEAWAQILGSPNEFALLVTQLGKIYQLPARVKADVESLVHPAKQSICLEWLPNVSMAIKNSSWNGAINAFAGVITDTDMSSIRFCATELSLLANEKEIKQNEIDDLLMQVNGLETDLLEANLDADVLRYIQNNLQEIRASLRDYRITGALPIEAAIERAAGSIIVSPDIAKRSTETPEGMKFWAIVGKLNTLVQISWNSLQIATEIFKTLS